MGVRYLGLTIQGSGCSRRLSSDIWWEVAKNDLGSDLICDCSVSSSESAPSMRPWELLGSLSSEESVSFIPGRPWRPGGEPLRCCLLELEELSPKVALRLPTAAFVCEGVAAAARIRVIRRRRGPPESLIAHFP